MTQTEVTYTGTRLPWDPVWKVERNGETLSPARSQAVWNHSPDGFSWGYPGSGPAQLALALLIDATDDDQLSVVLHYTFNVEYVAQWDKAGWWIDRETILNWVLMELCNHSTSQARKWQDHVKALLEETK